MIMELYFMCIRLILYCILWKLGKNILELFWILNVVSIKVFGVVIVVVLLCMLVEWVCEWNFDFNCLVMNKCVILIICLLSVKDELFGICFVFFVLLLIMYSEVLNIILVFLLICKLIVGLEMLCVVLEVFR